ncbi:MAG TPA: hypothetical protein VGW78_06300 [Candidatus Babeliales bacterium]|jgi:hypothetical protein|nr:hypothetical protein [Candidatus Babeliales bacterium]
MQKSTYNTLIAIVSVLIGFSIGVACILLLTMMEQTRQLPFLVRSLLGTIPMFIIIFFARRLMYKDQTGTIITNVRISPLGYILLGISFFISKTIMLTQYAPITTLIIPIVWLIVACYTIFYIDITLFERIFIAFQISFVTLFAFRAIDFFQNFINRVSHITNFSIDGAELIITISLFLILCILVLYSDRKKRNRV